MSRKPQTLSRKLNGKVLGIKCHDKLEKKLCWGKKAAKDARFLTR